MAGEGSGKGEVGVCGREQKLDPVLCNQQDAGVGASLITAPKNRSMSLRRRAPAPACGKRGLDPSTAPARHGNMRMPDQWLHGLSAPLSSTASERAQRKKSILPVAPTMARLHNAVCLCARQPA